MKRDICAELYSIAEKLVTDTFQKHHGYIDDWYDHGYYEAVFETYAHILAYLVKKRYKNMEDVEKELKTRALMSHVIGSIFANDGDDYGFRR